MTRIGAGLRGIVGVVLLAGVGHRLVHGRAGELARDVAPFATWPPLLALVGLAAALALLNVAASVAGWLRGRMGLATVASPAEAPAPATPSRLRRFGPDVALVAALLVAGQVLAAAWVAHANPHGVLVGRDTPTYLQNAVAAALGDWTLYNPDKHVLQARLAAALGWVGFDALSALRAVSRVSVGLVGPLGYLLARGVTGRAEALVVGVLCALHPWHLGYAPQSTAYPLYLAVTVAALAALVAAFRRPSLVTALVAGAFAGIWLSAMEKTPLALAPVVAVGLLVALPGARATTRTARWKGALVLAAGVAVALGTEAALAPPVPYTPFSAKVVVQREDLHRNTPWAWPAVKRPDPAAPTTPALPAALRHTEVEALVHVLTAPPDTDVLSLGLPDGRNAYRTRPNTTIPPLPARLATNLLELEGTLPALPRTSLLLLALGLVGLLVPGPGTGPRRWVALAPAAAIVSAWGPLSMLYSRRYVLHLVPVALVVAVVGLGRLLRLLVGPGRLAQGALTAATAAFWMVFAHALLVGDDTAWRRPALPTDVPAIDGGDDPGGNARATLEVARWLTAQPHAGPIVDCAPNPVWLLAYADARFTRPTDCDAVVARPRPDTWVVASSHGEFRGPRTLRPEGLLATGAWRVAGGWDPPFGRAIPAGSGTFTRSAVVVLEPVPATAGTPPAGAGPARGPMPPGAPPPVTGTR